ncbi:hypothetical protein ACFQ1L_02685 [Phytohabitans flavus]|uniref:hypothetical protein n=1 Tax=Phytohabitans flavus TaxID=1076124 RepID=UPI001E479C0A|nr:hypothetical protein [Phytohabitans flavus]
MTASTLDTELAAAAGRRWWNRWTIVLGLALLLVGGFVAGIEVQKAYGETPAATGPGGGFRGQGGNPGGGIPTAFPGGGFPGGPGGGAQGGRSAEATTGTVKLIDGTTVYVETESGEVVTVRTDGDTSVSVPGKLKDLKAGDKVSVEGGTDAEGSVTASSVTKTE